MPPEDFYITTFSITLDEFKNIFPWFEDLGLELEEVEKLLIKTNKNSGMLLKLIKARK